MKSIVWSGSKLSGMRPNKRNVKVGDIPQQGIPTQQRRVPVPYMRGE